MMAQSESAGMAKAEYTTSYYLLSQRENHMHGPHEARQARCLTHVCLKPRFSFSVRLH